MDITYDPAKNNKNIAERGLSFDTVAQFNFDTAATKNGLRVVSLRKANEREVKAYEQR